MKTATRSVLAVAAMIVLTFGSCRDDPVAPGPPATAYLWIEVASAPHVLRPGRTAQIVVHAILPDGSMASSYRATFESLDDAILRVDTAGVVTALAVGSGRVRVSGQDGATTELSLQVFGEVDRVVIASPNDTLLPHQWQALAAETWSGLTWTPADTVIWASSDTLVVRVTGSPGASIMAVGTGSATITARADTARASIAVTVQSVAFTALALGSNGTCGLDATHHLYCWGGHVLPAPPGAWTESGYPGPIAGAGYVALDFWTTPCTLDTLGTGYCWFAWGGGSTTGVVALSSGDAHNCSLDAAGTVRCAGLNDRGQAGSSGSGCSIGGKGGSSSISCVPAPTAVVDAPLLSAISLGRSHSCGLSTDGTAYCWGDNAHGQLGDSGTAWRYQARAVAGDGRFTAISAGDSFTCALDAAGATWCWGRNDAGQLGNGTTAAAAVPQRVQGAPAFVALGSARGAHICALTAGGEAWCWGSNGALQLGSPTASVGVPVAVVTALRFRSVAAGGSHSCGMDTAGVAWCWGGNDQGQLGAGGIGAGSPTPQRVASQP